MTRHLFALLVLSTLVLPGLALAKDETQWLARPSEAARIERVEKGLPVVSLPDGESLRLGLKEWMETYQVPGLSVAVFDNFEVAWAKGYGVREAGNKSPVTPETTFLAGSISKPVTALAAMRFVQDGRLSLDENINDKLLSWKVPDNEFTTREKVTLRRLLSHSAGLSVHGFPGYAVDAPLPTLVQILNGEKPANTAPVRVVMVPGTKFEYSGGGTSIVQLLLVDQLKKPFPDILAETVLGPLGLQHSSYQQPPVRAATAASGHHADGSVVPGKWHLYPEMAAAGLWTTPSDLAQVAIEVAKSKHGKSNRVLSKASIQEMLTIQKAPVGIGFFLDAKSDFFGHDGDDEGFQAALMAFSDSGKGAVVMANSENGFALFGPLLASIAKEYGWSSFTPHRTPYFYRFLLISSKLGVAKAIADYAALRASGPPADYGPWDLNAGGYHLLNAGKTNEAIQVFEANALLYPEDANAYDSLAEGYLTAGKKDLAVQNYQRSLKLNPKNENAVQALAKLGGTSGSKTDVKAPVSQ
jgi:CubicO group peptidase (beta-lactamase class C family)